MNYLIPALLFFCGTSNTIADCFHDPGKRFPIKIIGEQGGILDRIRLTEVRLRDVPAIEGFRSILRLVNGQLIGELPRFEVAVDLEVVEKLQVPISLELKNVSATLALQYITALTVTHFSVFDHTIVVFPESDANFQPEANQAEHAER
jgi:hypothetical protein